MSNTILSKFFSLFHSILMLDARRQVRAKYTSSQRYVSIREHHCIVFSSRIFILEPFSIYLLCFLIFSSTFLYFQILKTTFLSLSWEGVGKYLIGLFHSCVHLLPFIDHFCFLNLKIPKKISSYFNLLTFTLWIRPQLATVLNLNLNLKI